ncbi:rCG21289 [Rattus norvegicus]|uniref:Inactive 2'-5'-oligoadenylate synthase 1B n=1 Tax=Rattus norvegicus TaxID=10116 RepID=OAS1B_RAT|nr:inactive 2'-5'-oligoadenylate synthase 1B [Rattus norvegicus]Q5BKD0.1 RecName: Full=Inactive 2'-5'-oligoadenylate synthase 1B; Short=(2-5')oligo(A) synthase 1B; Short=2-5A synthase 1B [Rattus norvegicus]AAH91121.1 2-5 oligoadenylate synthetase 1B [Rattus norvegicus]EDM13762.1 rCG21289 [Rattus norvegicus]|eukprot:NP_653353.2 inactive 2'-5'-oligoadenylate synthase 1B [Rattus norvegicus]
MEQELRSIPASKLDQFIEVHLPDISFRDELREVIDVLCILLKNRCCRESSHPVRTSKVGKGGSSRKGTTLKGWSDADLVVFLDSFTCFGDQLNRRGEFTKEIKKLLFEVQRDRHIGVKIEVHSSWSPNHRALSFKLSAPDQQKEVKFDVLPAYDLLGHVCIPRKPNPQFYANLISERTSLGKEDEFSTCFTELQLYFLNWRPTKLKSLIRLVKHWYQLCKEKLGDPLPPQYALELLTIYAWERGGRLTKFNTAQGFRTVLELITKYKQLLIYWTVCYDFQHPEVSKYLRRQLKKPRPVILDPANPTGNIAGSNPKGWRRLAGEAAAWLRYPCFKYKDGFPVCPWDVPTEVDIPSQNYFFHIICLIFWLLLRLIFGKHSV